ncbi:MAG: DNA polymerase-3 subunit chi [Pseudohongiellaceae bacterium]|jgi:DNA polymerase-3 subunit chi
MTKVDFYVLPDEAIQQRYLFACRLIEKAYKLGNNIFVHGSSEQQLATLDELLWSFRSNSFLPHLYLDDPQQLTPGHQIVLGTQLPPEHYHDVMINLSNQVPDFFSRFERVSEIVVEHDKIKEATRNNFRFYRERGYEVNTHKMREQAAQN